MEFIPGVHHLNLFASNCYLIVEDGQLTLIDAGTSRSAHPIIKYIHSLGFSEKDLRRILLTHADYDHVGAVASLRAKSGAEVLASRAEADALRRGHSSRQIHAGVLTPLFTWFERLDGSMKIEVDAVISEGDTLPLLGGLEVLETPGHTPGHLSFYAPDYSLLFAGDSVSTRPDKVRYNRMKAFNWDQEQMIASVHRQHSIQPKVVCSGHGPVVFGAAEKFIDI